MEGIANVHCAKTVIIREQAGLSTKGDPRTFLSCKKHEAGNCVKKVEFRQCPTKPSVFEGTVKEKDFLCYATWMI